MFYQIQGFENRGKVLGGSYEIEIVRTLFLKLEKNVCQLFFRDFFSKSLAADGIILAITTAQSTAAPQPLKKIAPLPLVPLMQGSSQW